MNNIELTQLQASLKTSIEEFVSGQVSYPDAQKEYNKFKNIVEAYQKNLDPHSHGYLTSLCAAHSSDNFAKYTGIILLKNDIPDIIASYGSKTVKSNINIIIKELNHNIVDNVRQTKHISLTSFISYTFHYCKIIANENIYLIICATTSQFFSYKTFKYFTELVYRLITKPMQSEYPLAINYLSDVKKKIFDFFDKNSVDKHKLLVKLYCFDDILELFSHMGIDTLADIYDRITIKLKRIYSINSLILQTDGSTFAVITSDSNPEEEHIFSFFEVMVNYTIKEIELNDKTDVYKLWL